MVTGGTWLQRSAAGLWAGRTQTVNSSSLPHFLGSRPFPFFPTFRHSRSLSNASMLAMAGGSIYSLALLTTVYSAAATPPFQSDADSWLALSNFAQAQQDRATIPVGACEPNLGPPVLNAVPNTAYFTGLKAPSFAYGGPQRAPGEHVVAAGMQGTTEAPQQSQGIFDDFPANDSDHLMQHSGNETATEAAREYFGDDSTGYCFHEHGNVIAVIAACPVIEPLIVCVCSVVFSLMTTCAARNWTGRPQQFLQGGDDNNDLDDDSDPARNDHRDEFDSAPFTPVNNRRARDVSPGPERSRAPMRRLNTAPARMVGSVDVRRDLVPVEHFPDHGEHDGNPDDGSNGPEIAGDNTAHEMEADNGDRAVEPGGAGASWRPRRQPVQPNRYAESGLHRQSCHWNTRPILRWPN